MACTGALSSQTLFPRPYACEQAQRTDTAWLEELLLAHLPPEDTLQWRGVAVKSAESQAAGDDADFGACMCLQSLCGMGVPTIVWLCIGLPYSVVSCVVCFRHVPVAPSTCMA